MATDSFRPAPLDKRLFAALLDLAILSAAGILFFFIAVAGALLANIQMPQIDLQAMDLEPEALLASLAWMAIWVLVTFLAFDAYFIFFELKQGATPGKKTFGLKVVSLRSDRLTLWQCVIREVFRQIDNALCFFPLIFIFISPRHQRLGDLVAGTLVVTDPPVAKTSAEI